MRPNLERAALGVGATLALLAPLPLGGTIPGTAAVLALAAAIALLAGAASGRGGHPPRSVGVLVTATLGLGVAYLIPVPGFVVDALSPRLASEARLSLAFDGEEPALAAAESAMLLRSGAERSVPSWRPLAADPDGARDGALRLAAALAAFVLALVVGRDGRGRVILTWAVATSAFAQAALGLIEEIAGQGSLLGLDKSVTASVPTGTFVNPNHFAALLSLGLFAIIALMASGGEHRVEPKDVRARAGRLTVLSTGLAIVVVALMWSASRGALAAAATGIALFAIVAGFHFARARFGLAGPVALALLAAAFVTGSFVAKPPQALIAKLDRVEEAIPERTVIYKLTWEMTESFWRTGTGLGTYRHVESLFRPARVPVRFVHAHCDWLQWLAETGAPGAALLLGWIVVLGWAVWRVTTLGRERAVSSALAAGLVALAIHAGVDFPLQLPGIAVPAALLLGILVAPLALGPRSASGVPTGDRTWRLVPVLVAVGAVALAVSALLAMRPFPAEGARASLAPWSRDAERVRSWARRDMTRAIDELAQGALSRDAARERLSRALVAIHSAATRAPLRAELRVALFAALQARAGIDLPEQEPPSGFIDLQRHYLARAQALDPSSRARRLVLVRHWVEAGDESTARAIARGLIADAPHLAREAYDALGGSALDLGSLMSATPNTPDAASELARYLRSQGDLSGAEIVISRAYERHPDSAIVGLLFAEVLLNRRRTNEARALVESMPEPADDEPRKRWLRLRASLLTGAQDRHAFEGVIEEQEASGESPYLLALQKARAYLGAGDRARAIETLREALARREPPIVMREKLALLVALGGALESEGRVKEALETFRTAQKLDPEHPGVVAFFDRLSKTR